MPLDQLKADCYMLWSTIGKSCVNFFKNKKVTQLLCQNYFFKKVDTTNAVSKNLENKN